MTVFNVEGWEKDARAMPWAQVASRVASRVGPGATMRSAELAQLAAATGYSPQLLLRQVRLLAFLEAFAAKQRIDLANLIVGPFTTLEAASKLFAARGGDEVAAQRVKDAADRSTLTSVEALRSELRWVVGMRERAKSSSDRHVLTTHPALPAKTSRGSSRQALFWSSQFVETRLVRSCTGQRDVRACLSLLVVTVRAARRRI
jgi:hypothetical protein